MRTITRCSFNGETKIKTANYKAKYYKKGETVTQHCLDTLRLYFHSSLDFQLPTSHLPHVITKEQFNHPTDPQAKTNHRTYVRPQRKHFKAQSNVIASHINSL